MRRGTYHLDAMTCANYPWPAKSSSPMSTGTKIAIGVAVPIGVIAIGVLLAFVVVRRRRQKGMSLVPWQQRAPSLLQSLFCWFHCSFHSRSWCVMVLMTV